MGKKQLHVLYSIYTGAAQGTIRVARVGVGATAPSPGKRTPTNPAATPVLNMKVYLQWDIMKTQTLIL